MFRSVLSGDSGGHDEFHTDYFVHNEGGTSIEEVIRSAREHIKTAENRAEAKRETAEAFGKVTTRATETSAEIQSVYDSL